MAKKDDELNDIDLDSDLDFGDLDGDDGFGDMDESEATPPGKRSPIQEIKTGALDGLRLNSKDLSNVGKSISDNFRHFGSTVDSTLSTAGELTANVRELKESITPSVKRLKIASRRALPFAKKFVPTKIYDKLKSKLDTEDDATYQQQSLEDQRSDFIKDQLSNIFKVQIDLQEQQHLDSTKEKLIDDHVEDKQFATSITVLSKIKNILRSQHAFYQTGMKTFIVKSLELKYKHLFVAQDLLIVQRKMLDITDNKLSSIIFNTALPDIQKQNQSESFKEAMRKKTYGKVAGTVGEYAQTFFSKVSQNVKKNIFEELQKQITEYSDMGTELLEGWTEMEEMKAEEAEEGPSSAFKGMSSGVSLLKTIGIKHAGKLIQKLGGQHAKDFDDIFKSLKENAPFLINTKLQELKEKEGIIGKIAEFTGDKIIPRLEEERGIISNIVYENPTDPVPWDVVSRKTLIEIIPGYLSQITKHTETLATGKEADELAYDFGSETFVSVKELKQKTYKKYFGTQKSRAEEIEKLIGTIYGGYKNNDGDPDEFNTNMPNIIKFVNNIVKHAKPLLPKELLKFKNNESYNRDYISWVFKDIDDPMTLANVLVQSFFKEDAIAGDVTRKFTSESIDLSKRRDEYVRELGKLNVFGQKRHFTELVGNEKTLSQIEKFKEELIRKYKKKAKKGILDEKALDEIKNKVRIYGQSKEINHALIRNILNDIDYETLYSRFTDTGSQFSERITQLNKQRDQDKENIKSKIDKISISDQDIPLRDDPHISGPGVYAQGSEFEAHIPLDSPEGFFGGFKKILEEIDYKTTLVEIRDILEGSKAIQASSLAALSSQVATSMSKKGPGFVKKSLALITKPLSFIGKGKDLASGVLSKITSPMSLLKGALSAPFKIGEGYIKTVKFLGSKAISAASKLLSIPIDIYRKSKRKAGYPLVTKSQIENKELIRSDGKIVKFIKDIIMPILLRRTGEVVITEEDIKDGLVDVEGKSIFKKAIDIVKGIGKKGFALGKGLITTGAKAVSFGIDAVANIFNKMFEEKPGKKKSFFGKIKETFSSTLRSVSDEIIIRLDKIISLMPAKKKIREGSYEDYLSDDLEETEIEEKAKKSYLSKLKSKKGKKSVRPTKKGSMAGGLLSKYGGAAAAGAVGSALLTGAAATATTTAAIVGGAATMAGAGATAAGLFLVSNPIGWAILGTLAVGAIGYGAYKLFSDSTQEKESLKVRMEVYNVSKKYDGEIKSLESETLENFEDKVKMNAADVEGWADEFGLDSNDRDQVSFWLTWYKKRFVPALLLYQSLIKQNANKSFDEIDEIELEQLNNINTAFKSMTSSKLYQYRQFGPTKEAYNKVNNIKTSDRPIGDKLLSQIPGGKSRKSAIKSKSTIKSKLHSQTPSAIAARIIPDANDLGSLSAKYESGSKGSLGIGFDRTGGTSYGAYQIATRTGTFDQFLNWCDKNGAGDISKNLREAGDPDRGLNGPVAQAWKKLAKEGKINSLERSFIKETHYQPALFNLPESMKLLIKKSPALQQILWSTAVQHGGLEASSIFIKAYKDGISIKEFIDNIYNIRKNKFRSSHYKVRYSIVKRYRKEKSMAFNMIKSPEINLDDKSLKTGVTSTSVPTPIPTPTITTPAVTSVAPAAYIQPAVYTPDMNSPDTAMQIATNSVPDFMSKDIVSKSINPKIQLDTLVNINREQLNTLVDIRNGIIFLGKIAADSGKISPNDITNITDNMINKIENLSNTNKPINEPDEYLLDMKNMIDISKKATVAM